MGTVRQLVWFAIVLIAFSFTIFAVTGSVFTQTPYQPTIDVRDVVASSTHNLSGTIPLPLACDEITIEPIPLSPTEFELSFHTWQDPSVECPQVLAYREFHTALIAPKNTTFVASLDGKPFPILITSDVPPPTQ